MNKLVNSIREAIVLSGLKDGIVVETSSRYSLGNLLDVIGDFGKRSMGLSGIIYPYWENAVRLTEDYAALLLTLTALFALMPGIILTVTMVRILKAGWRKGTHLVKHNVTSAVERRKEKKWLQTAGKKD